MGMIIQNGKQYFPVYNDTEVKAMPTVDTASGSIATFNTDLTENLVEVKCQIVAKQASGTPSPDNPLPITTYTEMNVFATGKNFYKSGSVTEDFNGAFWSLGGDLGSNVPDGSLVLNAGTYTLSNFPTKEIRRFDETGARVDTTIGTMTFTLTKREKVRFAIVTNSQDYNIQIELGNTATTYEPFGTTSNIPFGQTVANGVLDISTGKLRVTHKIWATDGTETWNDGGNGDYYTTSHYSFDSMTGSSNGLSNYFTYNWSFSQTNGCMAYTNRIQLTKTSYESITDLVADFTNTPLVIVYPFATPIEIQLDSITLQALLNENNIWCDTGDTEVKFLLTVGKKIA